jgi:hypothetical protein
MSFSSKTRSRAYAAAAVALTALVAVGCSKDKLLQVTDPDVLNTGDYTSPAGADPLRFGAIRTFTAAFDGGSSSTGVSNGTDAFVTMTGNMADEMLASDTFDGRLTINARRSNEVNTEMEAVYTAMQKARSGVARAISIIKVSKPSPTYNVGQLYMYLGYTETFFAEGWCPGVPYSTFSDDGSTVFGKPQTTAEQYTLAVAHFDSALALADTFQQVKFGAAIGKARALLGLKRYADAATAVASVPIGFQLLSYHSSASSSNSDWSGTTSGASRYRLTSREGTNGLPFLEGTDARIKWTSSTRVGFSSQFTQQPNETKYGQYDSGVIGNGVEARLMVIENELQGGNAAAWTLVFNDLNALRATAVNGVAAIPAMTADSLPTSQTGAVNLYFKERAYWLWLTGHRLGDLRRLVRDYGRDPETVFPTGQLTLPLAGTYGTSALDTPIQRSTSVVIPKSERANVNYQGCLDGK